MQRPGTTVVATVTASLRGRTMLTAQWTPDAVAPHVTVALGVLPVHEFDRVVFQENTNAGGSITLDVIPPAKPPAVPWAPEIRVASDLLILDNLRFRYLVGSPGQSVYMSGTLSWIDSIRRDAVSFQDITTPGLMRSRLDDPIPSRDCGSINVLPGPDGAGGGARPGVSPLLRSMLLPSPVRPAISCQSWRSAV